MTNRWTNPTGGQRMTVRLTTRAAWAPAAAPARSAAPTPPIQPQDVLVLAETGERGRGEQRRGDEVLGRLRQGKSSMTLSLGDRTLTVRPEREDLLLVEERETIARFDDRRFRGDRIILTDGPTFPFEGDDERLTTADGAPVAELVAKNPGTGNRLVRVAVRDVPLEPQAATDLLAYAAAVVLSRRLPASPAGRFGMGGGNAGDSVGAKYGGFDSGGGSDGGGGL